MSENLNAARRRFEVEVAGLRDGVEQRTGWSMSRKWTLPIAFLAAGFALGLALRGRAFSSILRRALR